MGTITGLISKMRKLRLNGRGQMCRQKVRTVPSLASTSHPPSKAAPL